MPIESTLAIVKPDAFDRADDVVEVLKGEGFTVAERDVVTLERTRASEFYKEHAARPFFNDLVAFMTSGPVLTLVLRRESAVSHLRETLGPTDSEAARADAPASIRARFGTDVTRNAAHGSDSQASATREIGFFFPNHKPVHVSGKATKEWLNRRIAPVLTKSLTEMCRLMPEEPVRWLGEHLLELSGAPRPQENGHDEAPSPAPSPAATSTEAAVEVPAEAPKPNVYFVLGNAGSGKGSQCAKLVEKYGFAHLSAGDLLRAEVASGSEQGGMIDEMIKEGKIVPGHVTISLLKNAIEANQDKPGILIDGFPRKLSQAGAFEKDVSDFAFGLFFDCPEEELERRLLNRGKTSGRNDDNLESIRKRFSTFKETCFPVIEYYEAKGKVHRIDATQTIDEVFGTIVDKFEA